jgi:hypothetical protein
VGRLIERVVLGLLRLAGVMALAAAGALVTAMMAVVTVAGDSASGRTLLVAVAQSAAALAACGGGGLYLARRRTALAAAPGGWQALLLLLFIVALAWTARGLDPLLAFWRDGVALFDELGFFNWPQPGGGAGMGLGFVLFLAALGLPTLLLGAAASFAASAVFALLLIAARSHAFFRGFALCVVLQAALVLSGAALTSASRTLVPAVEQMIRETPDPGGVETARALTELGRYDEVTNGASRTLWWMLGASLVLLTVFLTAAEFTPASALEPVQEQPDLRSTSGAERVKAYEEAARRLESR